MLYISALLSTAQDADLEEALQARCEVGVVNELLRQPLEERLEWCGVLLPNLRIAKQNSPMQGG